MEAPSTEMAAALISRGCFASGVRNHGAGDGQGGAHVLSGDLFIILQGGGIHNDLQILEAGAVVELNKAEGLHVPDRAGPAGHGDFLCRRMPPDPAKICAIFVRSIGVLPLYVVVGFHSTLYYTDSNGILQGFLGFV